MRWRDRIRFRGGARIEQSEEPLQPGFPEPRPGHTWLAIEVPDDVASRYALAERMEGIGFSRKVIVMLVGVIEAWERNEFAPRSPSRRPEVEVLDP